MSDTLEALKKIPTCKRQLIWTPPTAPPGKDQDRKDLLNNRHPEIVEQMVRICGCDSEHLILPSFSQLRRVEESGKRSDAFGLMVNPFKGTVYSGSKWVNADVDDVHDAYTVISALRDHAEAWNFNPPLWIHVNDELVTITPDNADQVLHRQLAVTLVLREVWPTTPIYWYNAGMSRGITTKVVQKVHHATPYYRRSCSLYVTSAEQAATVLRNTKDNKTIPGNLTDEVLAWVDMRGGYIWERPDFHGEKHWVNYEGEWGRRLCWQLGALVRDEHAIGVSQPQLLEPHFAANFGAFIHGVNGEGFGGVK